MPMFIPRDTINFSKISFTDQTIYSIKWKGSPYKHPDNLYIKKRKFIRLDSRVEKYLFIKKRKFVRLDNTKKFIEKFISDLEINFLNMVGDSQNSYIRWEEFNNIPSM